MKKQYSLRFVLTSILVIFVIGLLSIIYFLQTNFLDDFYRTNKINYMSSIMTSIDNGIRNNDLADTLDNLYLKDDVCIRIESPSGVLTGHNKENACALTYLNDYQIAKIYKETKDNGDKLIYDNFTFSESGLRISDLYLMNSIEHYHGGEVMIMVSSFITPVDPTITTLKSMFFMIASVVVITTIALAFIISKMILKPINQFKNEASSLAEGKYDGDNVVTNISELNELNQTLIESKDSINAAEIARKELLSNVSHDLRTPLTMIVGYGEMMQDFDEEKNDENIQVIIDEAKRLSVLVNDILDLSKLELGKIEMHKYDISLNEMLNAVSNQYQKYMEQANIEYIFDTDKDVIVNTDANRLKQVLYNFINNAINYNGSDHPLIKLSSRIENDKVYVEVFDNGVGIKEEDLPLVWERYYKVDHEHRKQSIGSGIGLSLSKCILDNLNIEYYAKSEVGKYSIFGIILEIQKTID